MTEKKENKSLIFIIVVTLLVILGMILYMIFAQDDNDNVDENTINENNTETEQLTMSDVIGSYTGTFTMNNGTQSDELNETNETDNTTIDNNLVPELDTNNTTNDNQTQNTNDTNNTTNDNRTQNTDDTNNTTNDNNYVFELVLNEDGTAQLVRTDRSQNVVLGTYTVTDNRITLVTSSEQANTEGTATNNMTYEFKVNSDMSLSYTEGTHSIILDKTDNDELEYIQ